MVKASNEVIPLNIKSVRDLSFRLGVKKERLISIANKAGSLYKPFEQKSKYPPFRKKPFTSKSRNIDNPSEDLKAIQKQINKRLLQPVILPDNIYGGVKGRSVLQNALEHVGANVVITLDIKSYFPNISNQGVFFVWRNVLGCGSKVASILTKLTTFERRLPQGAATSTSLANLFLLAVDQPIRAFCAENNISYTNWVDDLAFSGKNAREAIPVAVKALRLAGLPISRKKLKIMPASRRQVLTGVILNNRVAVTEEHRKATRAAVHKLATNQIMVSQITRYCKSILGRIAYVRFYNSKQADSLHRQFEQARRQPVVDGYSRRPHRPTST